MGEGYMALEVYSEEFARQQDAIEALMTTDPQMQEMLRATIAAELKEVRDRVVSHIKFENGDPRGTVHAVKRYVAARYYGGVISILDGKTKHGTSSYEAPRKVYPGVGGQRGGNRRVRSNRTDDILHLAPQDRGFILRMVSSGTRPRYANGRNGNWKNGNNKTFFQLQEQGDYFRGAIAPRNIFRNVGEREMNAAAERLKTIIEQEVNKLFGNG
jgi:hypothetical protein